MKHAYIGGEEIEATKERRGIKGKSRLGAEVQCCSGKMLTYWRHKRGETKIDHWGEPETKWHRDWKNHFPEKWQEVIHTDSGTGEKHIADIKTDKGFVIEFQHSAIKPDEIKSREDFYKNMVWVVDGTRFKRDYPRFSKRVNEFRSSVVPGFFYLFFPKEVFPGNWITSSVPVYFDFKGTPPIDLQNKLRDSLCCLLPGRVGQCVINGNVDRKQFIELALTNAQLLLAKDHFSLIIQHVQQQRSLKEKKKSQQGIPLLKYPRNSRRQRFRF